MSISRILWLDLETTGLDLENDIILEVGAVLTNRLLERRGQFARVIDVDRDKALSKMDATVLKMHTDNGLLDDLEGDHRVSLADAEKDLLAFLERNGCEPGRTILAGSGVSHFDIRWLTLFMPDLVSLLHHATIDIGVLRRFVDAAVSPRLAEQLSMRPERPHRALDDARAALASAQQWAVRLAAVSP